MGHILSVEYVMITLLILAFIAIVFILKVAFWLFVVWIILGCISDYEDRLTEEAENRDRIKELLERMEEKY